MSATRYDALAVRKYKDRDGNEKSSFTNIGVAFPMRDKDGFSLRLHAMPAPVDGEYSIILVVPKPREDREAPAPDRSAGDYGAAKGGRASAPASNPYHPDIPF